jgi:hypothetical protein
MSDPLLSAPYGNAHTAYRRGCFAQVFVTHANSGATVAIDTARSASGITLTSQAGGLYTFQVPTGTGRAIFIPTIASNTSGALATDGATVASYTASTGVLTVRSRAASNGATAAVADGDELQLLCLFEGG